MSENNSSGSSWIWIIGGLLALSLIGGCSGGSSGGDYDKSDKYYSSNDYNSDGYLSGNEFQSAVSDYMDDHGY